jgi:hypothetical protein
MMSFSYSLSFPLTNFSPYNDGGTSFPCCTNRIRLRGIKRENLFETNLVLPPIGQVVLIEPRLLEAEVKIMEVNLARIIVEDDATNPPNPIWLPTNEESMQMFICPIKRDLQDVMKLGNRAIAAYQQATPDLRADLSYPDTQLIDLNCLLCVFHFSFPLCLLCSLTHYTCFTRFCTEERDSLPMIPPQLSESTAISPRIGMVSILYTPILSLPFIA